MNSNIIPESISPLAEFSAAVETGARNHGLAVGLKQNTVVEITFDRESLYGQSQLAGPPDPNAPIGKQPAYEQAYAAAAQARSDARLALAVARALCATATDVLRQPLGRRWNSRWVGAGFSGGSLALPGNPVARLSSIRAYLRVHPGHANTPLGVTEASVEAALAALSAANGVVQSAERAVASAKQERDLAVKQLRRRLTAVRQELGILLSASDARWYDFGFNRPVDGRIPAVVTGVILRPLGPGVIEVTWDDSARAENYRVTRQIAGSFPLETVEVGLFADGPANITGLPSGATVAVGVSARNDAGETQPTVVSVAIP